MFTEAAAVLASLASPLIETIIKSAVLGGKAA